MTQDELVDALAYQLELVGLDLGPNPGVDRVLMAADAFLAEVSALSERIGELTGERDELQVEVADARHALEAFDAAERAAAEPTIDLTDSSVASASDGRHHRRADRRARASHRGRGRLRRAARGPVRAGRRGHPGRGAGLEPAHAAGLAAGRRARRRPLRPRDESIRPASDPAFDVDAGEGRSLPEAIEFYLLARLAAQRPMSFSGSVPLVIDDALAGLDVVVVRSLLDKLERMSEAVQIIYLSDDPEVADWVASVGIQRAAVVAAPHQFA